ncbi:hypothetical protein C482_19239 [Natrialba chahannaoensis JCM 10990]|uniref:Uncharacterized protein n=1 Tax=Natrialba chahannaoensis JCM 10990 TaxID=1227492 RepID=M0A4U5_9EURY|nr:hypothetical protein [Natrialba chahannaoensis]ELY93564.1 hypothetical protein C482_19239 [Natrialba chahannaoensis JCM 10990]
MSQAPSLFQNPFFRWGIAAFDAAIIAGIGLFLVEDETLQLGIYAVAVAALIITPIVLKRAASVE